MHTITVIESITDRSSNTTNWSPSFNPMKPACFTVPQLTFLDEHILNLLFGYSVAMESPRFSQPLKDVECLERKKLRLEVRVTGKPEPEVRFYKEGDLLVDGGKYHIGKEGPLYYLDITKTDIDDEGRYTCKASNPVGFSETSCEVIVECKYLQIYNHACIH